MEAAVSDEPRITKVETFKFTVELRNMGTDRNGFNLVYVPGNTAQVTQYAIVVQTSTGINGEFLGGIPESYAQLEVFAEYLIGKNPLHREQIYNDVKRALRKNDRLGFGPVDIALWDFAGKYRGSPVYELLGGAPHPLPAYASTYHGDRNGGLDSPQAFADFAVQCKEMGYPAFKIHPWGDPDIPQEIENVLAVREAVGDTMDLMLDPACEYETWADTLAVGRALDEARYFWYEDPFKDGGVSAFAHRKLRELLRTPLLLTEHVRGLEQHVDFIVAGGTDFVRVDAYYDGGLTGAIKICHAAEGFGLDAEIHAPGPAHRHLMASIRNTNFYELGLLNPKATDNFDICYLDYSDAIDAVDQNGCVHVPDGPGLGVQLNWDYILKNRTGGRVWE